MTERQTLEEQGAALLNDPDNYVPEYHPRVPDDEIWNHKLQTINRDLASIKLRRILARLAELPKDI
jgi:hypothetical protein